MVCTAICWIAPALFHGQEALPQISPTDLVRQTVAREVAAANQPSRKQMFRSRKHTPKGSQTRLYVQQQQSEMDHLNWLAGNPEQLRKKQAREKEDADRTLRIVKSLPDAFRYKYAGAETGGPDLGKTGDQLVRLEFTPNPAYSPPSRVEQVLEGMQGYLLIDASAHRIARIDGTLFREVSFGWGIFGHLDKGGHFRVQQAEVGDGDWEITAMNLQITGKILLFKGISMISDEILSDFHRVPDDLTFAKAVDILKTEQEKLAHNHEPEAAAEKKDPR